MGTAASDATVSTISNAPSSSATCRKLSRSVITPDEVSPCASPTILILRPLPARRTSSASTGLPYGASTFVTLAGVHACNHRHAIRKRPVDRDDGFVALFQRIDDARFDAARTRRRQRHRDPILGLKDLPQHHLDVVHASAEPRIDVPDQRRSQCAVDARVHGRWTRREHKSIGRSEFADLLGAGSCFMPQEVRTQFSRSAT